MKIFLLFYMCHFAMGLTHCYKTTVFLHLYCCTPYKCFLEQITVNLPWICSQSLLYELFKYGVRGVILNWFRDYLTNRKCHNCRHFIWYGRYNLWSTPRVSFRPIVVPPICKWHWKLCTWCLYKIICWWHQCFSAWTITWGHYK